MQRLTGLAPAAGQDPCALLLGSMPSALSLAAGEYYANPRNHFWALACAALGEEDPGVYEKRLLLLFQNGVALWDAVASCERAGSLDKNIREAVPNDIPGFLRTHDTIRHVFFNGSAAQAVYGRHFPRLPGVSYTLLPSSSPVPRRIVRTLEDKLPAWRALAVVKNGTDSGHR